MTVTMQPGSQEWTQTITPSKVAAILGVSRWESPYRLWHRIKGLVDPEPPKDIFDLGHDFEDAMANIWRRENPGWRLSRGEVQIHGDTHKFGFPCAATIDRRAARGRARRVVEFKTARSLEEWGDEFTDEAPADYVAQVTAEMLFTGYTQHPAHLMVLGPYFKAHTYVIEFDQQVADWIVQRCREFWESLQGDEPPLLDDSVATYECVRELHPDIDGSTVQYDLDAAAELLHLAAEHKDLERQLRGAKTRLLDVMGNAQYAEAAGVRIADRRPHSRGGVALSLAHKNIDQITERAQEMSA